MMHLRVLGFMIVSTQLLRLGTEIGVLADKSSLQQPRPQACWLIARGEKPIPIAAVTGRRLHSPSQKGITLNELSPL
jgi:hypothetical protein